MKLPRNSESKKISRYCGGIAICSSRVLREVSAALFRRSGIGSVLFVRSFLSFCYVYRSLQSKSIFS